MNNRTLVIYDFNVLYDILVELEDYLGFKIFKIKKIEDLEIYNNEKHNTLLISKEKIFNDEYQLKIFTYPVEISKLV